PPFREAMDGVEFIVDKLFCDHARPPHLARVVDPLLQFGLREEFHLQRDGEGLALESRLRAPYWFLRRHHFPVYAAAQMRSHSRRRRAASARCWEIAAITSSPSSLAT